MLIDRRILRRFPPARVGGFSLIELLAVISVIAVLTAIIIPAVGNMRERAATTQTVNTLKMAWNGMMLYAQDNGNRLPRGFRTPEDELRSGETPQSWQVQIGPYIFADRDLSTYQWKKYLRNSEDTPLRDFAAPEATSNSLGLNVFICPRNNSWNGWNGYLAVVPNPGNTILIGSRDMSIGSSDYVYSIGNPVGAWCQPGLYHQNESAGAFVFVDGHVEFIDEATLTYGSPAAAARPDLWKWD
jgi:prepilin-type N-terminal cleavage/methylation domain-containing protein/prepilin-type processing-associated H-X9-DG protein